jgi:hypothetical protein
MPREDDMRRAARAFIAVAVALAMTTIVIASCNNDSHPPLAGCVHVALDGGSDGRPPDGASHPASDASISCTGPTAVVGGPGGPGSGTGANVGVGGVPGGGTIGNGGTDNGVGGTGAGGTPGFAVGGNVTSFGGTGTGVGLGGAMGTGIPGGTLPGVGGLGF